MKKPILLAVATQKGGAGKSTLTVHLASILHYHYRYKVAVLDCDYPQNTITGYRKSDTESLRSSPALGVRFIELAETGVTPYQILQTQVETGPQVLEDLLSKSPDLDFVFFDLPGTINRAGLGELLLMLDYVFAPVEPDKGTIASTLSFLTVVDKLRQNPDYGSEIKGLYPFWNKYNKSEKASIYEKGDEYFASKGYHMLASRIEALVAYKNERNTLLPLPARDLDRLNIGRLVTEILTLINGGPVTTPSGAQLLPLTAATPSNPS